MTRNATLIEIRDADGGVEIRAFDRQVVAAGLRVGSDPGCALRLDDAQLPGLVGLLEPRSNHWVWHVAKDGVLPEDYTRRVDYGAIQVGDYTIRVLPPPEELE